MRKLTNDWSEEPRSYGLIRLFATGCAVGGAFALFGLQGETLLPAYASLILESGLAVTLMSATLLTAVAITPNG
jgi:hypothetical protein